MSFNDCKISESQIQTTGVQSQPDTLTGSAADNKMVFDALPTLVIQKLNSLIDQMQQQAAAGQVGVTPFDGMTAQTLQDALEQIQADIGGNYSGADGAGKVGYTPSEGVDEDTSVADARAALSSARAQALSAFADKTQEHVTGSVKLKLYKGNIITSSITSPESLYSEELVTFNESSYDQTNATGFINLWGLPDTVQALRELAQSGVAVVIATGRARYTAQWVLGSGIKPDYFAAVNGADVTDAAGRPVWQSRMTPEEMYALVDFCEDHELPLEFIFSDAYYVYVEYAAFVEKYCGQNAASGFFDSVLRDGEDQVRHLQDMPFGACAAMDARHAAAFEAKYGHLGLRFIPFAPGRYDVLRAGAGKAAGVGRLLERLGISWAETAAFGDGENDAELLEAAGFAVAMEGGAQSLLPLADAVAPAAALDGAAAAVREYLLE